MPLPTSTLLEVLTAEGPLFARAVEVAGADAPVPTCPDWTIRDLVHHQGEVHRWATAVVGAGLLKPSSVPDDIRGPLPADGSLVEWLLDGHGTLVATLRAVDPDIECFTFLADSPPPAQFWARRQAHETTMHRVDAESASAGRTAIESTFAADGIDEMLMGFAPRPRTALHSEPAVTLRVDTTDAAGHWLLTIAAGPARTERIAPADLGAVTADCVVAGPASVLYRSLWNRTDTAELTVTGNPAILSLFRDSVRIRWS